VVLSEYELTSLVFALFRDMDSMIQFWIQATFAVVVAVFVAGDRLSRWMRGMIAVLYLIASVQAALRWSLIVSRVDAFRARMVADGFADIPTHWGLVQLITALIFVMFVGGVLGTVYFVARSRAGRADAKALNQHDPRASDHG
jgi:4-amino-4-deoxy-L-arabinose transferase-like glycosyltransferase